MCRLAIIVTLLAVAGCSQSGGGSGDLRPFVAVAGKYSLLAAPPKKPSVCETCNGTGRVGDGRVWVPCPACAAKACVSGTCRK